ncbi:CARDB domain-containing protein [Aquincola sp. MAHUQ-54]|uniref:CARDB domain-containing protein n=1 Tax=Aquincola agrisoli TaxID=3119538 RepID=A0AAW9QIJ8_9BURK
MHRSAPHLPARTLALIQRAITGLKLPGSRPTGRMPELPALHFEPLEQRMLMSADLMPGAGANGAPAPVAALQVAPAAAALSVDLASLQGDGGGPRFVADFDTDDFSTPLQPLSPRGSLVHAGGVAGELAAQGERDSLSLTVEAGRSVSLRFSPALADSLLRAKLEVFNAADQSLGFVEAGEAGQALALRIAAGAGGALRIDVSSLSGAGAYQVELFLDAVLEGTDSTGMDDAVDLSAQLAPLPGGTGSHTSIIGRLDPAGLAAPLYVETFENGLAEQWSLSSSHGDATIGTTSYYDNGQGSNGGSYGSWGTALYSEGDRYGDYGGYGGEPTAATIGTQAVGGYDDALNEAIWTVNVAGRSNLLLEFDHWGYDPVAEAFSGSAFTGSEFADGIAASVDGITWVPVATLAAPADNGRAHHTIDLSAALAAHGLTPTSELRLKFQHADTPHTGEFGELVRSYRYWDNLTIREAETLRRVAPAATTFEGSNLFGSLDVLGDGITPAEGSYLDTNSATTWLGDVEGQYPLDTKLVFDLGGNVLVSDLELSVDGNDDYAVDYSLDGEIWSRLTTISRYAGEVGYGMETLSSIDGAAEYEASIDFEAVEARWLRVYATGGDDNYFGVGEVRVMTSTQAGDNQDWHRIDLEAGDVVSLALQFAGGQADAGALQLFDADGRLLTLGTRTGSTGAAISGFSAPAAGTYYVRVGGSQAGEYHLAVTKDVLLGGALSRAEDITATPVVVDGFRAPTQGGSSGTIRVAVHRGDSTLISRLNDSTHGIQAVSVAGTDIDTAAELANYDVVMIGHSSYEHEFEGFAAALRDWVEAGGGVIATGWTVYGAGTGYAGSSGDSSTAIPDIDAIVPVATGGRYDSQYSGLLDIGSIAHPITEGLGDFYLPSIYVEYAAGGADPGATTLAELNGRAAVVAGEVQSGRGVYLGPTYFDYSYLVQGDLDRLLEQAVVWASGDGTHDYTVRATAGDTLTVTAEPVGSADGEPGNTLVPTLEVVDEDNTVVASSATGSLSFVAGDTGRYRIRLGAESGQGDVILRVAGSTAAAADTFGVSASSVDGLLRTTYFPGYVDIEFGQPLLLTSLTAQSLTIDGQAASSFTVLDGSSVRFFFDGSAWPDGEHTLALAAGALTDIRGQALEAWSHSFELDTTLPVVTAASIAQQGRIDGTPSMLTIDFSEALDTEYLDSSDVSLVDVVTGNSIALTSFHYDAENRRLELGLPALEDGRYQLALWSGYYAFKDLLGLPLNGDPSDPLPSGGGDNTPDNFVLDFIVDQDEQDFAQLPPFAAQGSLVHGRLATGGLNGQADTDAFTVMLTGDQLLTVFARATPTPLGDPSDLVIGLKVFDAAGNLVASADGVQGEGAVLQTVRAAGGGLLAAGTYRIELSNLAGDGGYELGLLLGARAEGELAQPGTPNNTPQTAEDIASSFVDLGNGGSRGAVVGSLVTPPQDGGGGEPVLTAQDADTEGDYYRFTLRADEYATIVLAPALGGQFDGSLVVDLLDADGNLLATSHARGGAAVQAIREFKAGAAGDYLLRVRGDSEALYNLTVTRSLSFELPQAGGTALQDISGTHQALGHLSGSGSVGSGAVRVAVFNGGSGASLVAQLNDDTWFDFTATSVTANQIDTVEELSQYDVVVIGDEYNHGQYGTFAQALRQWVEGGGGLVATGWTVYAAGSSTSPVLPDIDAIVPVDTTVRHNYYNGGTVNVADASHPATDGLTDFQVSGYIEYSTGGADPGAQTLATVNGRAFAVVGQPQDGRSAYLGAVYYDGFAGNNAALDRLLEQTVAWAAGDRDDSYVLQVAAGDVLTLTTQTPGDGGDTPLNTLATRIELYDAGGTLVASNERGAADGRNALLTHIALDGGTYRVRVVAVAGEGDYVVSVDGATGGERETAPQVVAVTPAAGALLSAPPTEIVVELSEGVRADSVSVDDLVLDNGGTVVGVEMLAGHRLRFLVELPPEEGTTTFRFAAGAFTDLQGTPSEAFESSFVYDLTGPRVVASSPDAAAQPNAPFNTWTFTFNENVDAATVGYDDVLVFTGPAGQNLRNQVQSVTASGNTLTVTFTNQYAAGIYTLVLGPDIRDRAGNLMDQDGDGIAGEAEDSHTATVTLRSPDLTPVVVTAPASGSFGAPISVTWTVKNAGNGATNASYWYDGFWLSRDTTVSSDDIQLSDQYIELGPLAADGSYTRTASLTLPLNTNYLDGTYYLLLRTDRHGYQGEADETNNTLASEAFTLTVPPLPDLVAEDVQVAPVVEAGKATTITWTTRNQGTAATATGWYDHIYLSADASYGSGDIYIGQVYNSSSIAAGGTLARSANLTIPLAQTGQWHVIVRSDVYDYVEEFAAEGNNETASAATVNVIVPTEDLVPTAVAVPEAATFGDRITVAWSVQNQGTGPTVGNWTDRLWLSTDDTRSDDDIYLGEFSSSGDTPLAAGGVYHRSRDITLPLRGTLNTGSYRVLVQTDYYGNEPETNEANNVRASSAITLTVPPFADLTVSNVTVPDGVRSGNTTTVRFTLTNQGTAPASDFRFRLVLTDSNVPGSSSHHLGDFAFNDTLRPGQSIEIAQDVTLPISAPGNWYVGVTADIGNVVFEHAAEDNNSALSTLTSIPLPPLADLRVTDIVAPADALSGQVVPITWTVTNQGSGSIIGGRWVDRVYLSTDGGASNGIFVGDFSYEGDLAAGASVTRTQNITVPGDRIGSYTVVVRTDINGDNYEYDGEDNNRTVDNTTLVASFPPLPNLTVASITPPSDAFSGTQTIVSWVVTNTGNGSTSVPRWLDTVVLSLNDVYGDGDDIVLGSVANPSYLADGESYVNTLTFTVPRGLAGDYRLLVKADANHQVFENTAEGDNVGVSALTRFTLTPPPDLRVTAVQAPTQAFSGQPMSLNWTVTNAGDGRTAETSWYDRVYVSTDNVFDAGDLALGTFFHSGALDGGESYTATHSVTLPVGEVGERWFFVVSDIYNNVYEHANENDNAGGEDTATNVVLTPPPDLEVSSITLPASARAGNTLEFSYSVTNYGATATAESYWTDTFYLSADAVLDAGDLVLGTRGHGGVLGVDGSYGATPGFKLPDTLDGAYYLIVHTDSGNQVFEGFAGANGDPNANNVAVSAAPIVVSSRPANLVIESFTAPATGEAGKQIVVTWTLRNAGTGATQANYWIDQIIASNDDILGDDDDIVLASTSPGEILAAGATLTQSAVVSLPFGMQGNYKLFLRADATQQVFEGSGEGDNVASLPLTVTRDTPDLVVSSLSATAPQAYAEPIVVTWRVDNEGDNRTNANYWSDRVWLSRDGTLGSGDVLLGTVSRGNPLAAGEGYDATAQFALPSGFGAGDYFVIVETDVNNLVTEGTAGEANNLRASATPITIPPEVLVPVLRPDLRVERVDAPAEAISGQALQVSWTVRNDSTDPTGARNWYDAVYLSRDLVFDRATDLYLGYADHAGGLAAGASYTQTKTFTVPYGQSGPFYVFVVADGGNGLPELVETNNAGVDSGFTQVTLAPPADLLVGEITIPVNAIPGRDATITYTVTNQGTNPALGSWRDSIYLSADDTWDIGDLLFGTVQHNGPVAGGASYTEALTAALPGLTPGNYRVIVRSDILNTIAESNEGNNVSASLDAVAIDVETLALGTPASGTIATGQAVFYKVVVGAGETVRVVLDSDGEDNGNELYLRYGSMPTRGQFDHTGRDPFVADQLAVIPTTEAGTYYVMLYGADGRAPRPYTLTASILPFSLQSVDQAEVGNGGTVTLQVDGAKFDAQTQFALINGAGESIFGTVSKLENSSRAYVTFDARGAAAGAYSLAAEAADGTVALYAEQIQVVDGGGAEIVRSIQGPAEVRPGRVILANLVYANEGDADTMAPLFIVTSPTGTRFGSTAESIGLSSSVQLLGVAPSGPQDILRPGDHHSLPLLFESVNAPMSFTTRVIQETSTEPIDYALLEQSLRMPGMTDTEWQTRWLTQLQPRLGGTWGDYVRLVNALSKQYSTPERTLSDVRELFDIAFTENPAFLASMSYSGTLQDADTGAAMGGVEMAVYRQTGTTYVFAGRTTTAADGRFTLGYLQPGTYTLALGRVVPTEDGGTDIERPYSFDLNRNGIADAASPVFTITEATDIAGAALYARLTPVEPTPENVDLAPAMATDASGLSHMVWTRDGVFWHAVNDGTGWKDAQPLPGNVAGDGLQLAADPRLIDGNREGLLATWRQGEGNAAEVYYSVGARQPDGTWQWTAAAKLTDNAQFDGAYAIGIGADGKPVLMVQRKDATNPNDDFDLYGGETAIQDPVFVDVIAQQMEELRVLLDAMSDAELEAMGVHRIRFSKSIGNVNLGPLGSVKSEIRVDLQAQIDCTLIFRGNGAFKFDINIGGVKTEIEGRAGGDVRYVADHDTCVYVFKSARINAQVSGAVNVPLSFIPVVGTALTAMGVKGRFEVAAGGNLVWDAGADFPGWWSSGSGSFRGSVGLNWEGSIPFTGLEAVVRALINVNGKWDDQGLGMREPPISGTILVRVKHNWFFGGSGWTEYTYTYPGSDMGSTGMDGDLLTLDDAIFAGNAYDTAISFGFDPRATGTLNDYTGAGETAITSNLQSEGEPVIAESPTGELWAAWASEDGVHVARHQNGAWQPASLVPGSGGYSARGLSLAFDGNGDAIALWNRLDTSGLTTSSSSAQIQAVLESGGDLVFARFSAGAWSAPQALTTAAGEEQSAKLVRLANGDVLAAWTLSTAGLDAYMPSVTVQTALWSAATGTWGAVENVAAGRVMGALSISQQGGRPVLVWAEAVNSSNATVLRSSTRETGGWTAAGTLQIAISQSLVDVAQALEGGSTLPPADGDGALEMAGLPLPSPPEECCDEEDPPPYEPDPVVPRDPNDILGPAGFGEERWIAATDTLAYTIRFENAADAAAPAQEVVVTQQLDADLDWRTFRVDDFGFGDQRVELSGTTAFYQARLDFSATKGYLLDVSASIDTATGIVTWRLTTLDPATGELPVDAQLGFLPPNRNAEGVSDGRGEGFLSYTIKAKRTVATGTVIDATARIVFDTEEPIDTPPIFNTLDAGLPSSAVTALPATTEEPTFLVSWSGADADGGSALASYTIYVSTNGGDWNPWLVNTTLTESLYEGVAGNHYAFFSVARDNAGNVEAVPETADAMISVGAGSGSIVGIVFDDTDGDGRHDTGEAGLGGWTMFLDTDGDGVLDEGERTTLTAADGSYRFDDVGAGLVTVGRVLPQGWLSTSPADNRQVVTVVADGTAEGADFGSFQRISLGGVKFDDSNANGVLDAGEALLAGWTIQLDRNGDGSIDATAVTGADGSYRFENLGPGVYHLSEVAQAGWLRTTPGNGVFSVVATSGLAAADLHFASVRPASISGVKFEDVDGDGQRDEGEGLLAGWTIFLDSNGNGTLDAGERSTVTGTDGSYRFDDLLPGSYTVAEVMQAGWMQTAPATSTGSASIGNQDQALELPDAGLDTAALSPSATAGNGWANTLTGLDAFRADSRFSGITGSGLSVVVIDTGIDLDHAFFGPDTDGDGIADRIVYQYDFANDDADASDRNNHGSHISSIIGGADGTYGGVAQGVDLIALKVFQDSGKGYFSYLENALRWVVAHADEFNVGVVNLSLGDGGNWNTAIGRFGLADELAALAEKNIIVTAASGNNYAQFGGAWGVAYPAADPAVLAVGATWAGDLGGPWNYAGGASDYTTGADQITAFSQRDDELLDVFAPGARLTGANASGGLTTMQGTSQASAYMAGIAALAQDLAQQALGRRLSLAEFTSLLDSTSQQIVDGDDENDNVRNSGLGFNRVDMLALAEAILALPAGGGTGTPGGSPGQGGGSTQPLPSAAPAAHSVTVVAGGSATGLDFGNFKLGRIDGTLYHDADADGVRDAGEDGTGLGGFTVFLDANGNGVADVGESTTLTDANGAYRFTDLGPGTRSVVVAAHGGWKTVAGQAAATITSGVVATPSLSVNALPTIDPVAGTRVDEGSPVTVQLAGRDSAGDTLRYELVGEVPAGAAIGADGVFSWTPADGSTTQTFTVRVTDLAGSIAERSFDVQVDNVAPTLAATGAATASTGQPYVLSLSATDPGADTIGQWVIDWGDGLVQTVNGHPASVSHSYAAAGSYQVSATAIDEDGSYTVAGPQVQVAQTPLQVTAFAATNTGFTLRFNRVVDAASLNLYDAASHGFGAADIVFANAAGQPVAGSVVLDADGRGLTFVKTGGTLAAGAYSVRLASGATAFADLDGNGDGTAGDAYTTSFTAAAGGAVLSIGEIARGPGQPVDLPATGSGFPITLTGAAGAKNIVFTLRYDASLLNVTGVINGAGLPAGSSLMADLSVAGEVRITITAATPLGAGALELLRLQSTVRADARYGASQVLDLSAISINGGTIPVRDDDGLHVVAYLGDTDGSRGYGTADVERLQRVLTRADSGFGAFPLIDAMVLGDINASGTLTSLDAARLQQKVGGADRPEIPTIPVLPPPAPVAPSIDLAGSFADFELRDTASAQTTWLSDWMQPASATAAAKAQAASSLIKLTPANVAPAALPTLK